MPMIRIINVCLILLINISFMSKFQFSICLQYISQRIANSIFQIITNDFILPSWIQKYHSTCDGRSHSKEKVSYQCNIIDYRFLKAKCCLSSNQALSSGGLQQIGFLLQDQEYFNSIKQAGEEIGSSQNRADGRYFKDEEQCVKSWEQGLAGLNIFLKESQNNQLTDKKLRQQISNKLKEEKCIKVILFSLTQHNPSQYYFLIRLPKDQTSYLPFVETDYIFKWKGGPKTFEVRVEATSQNFIIDEGLHPINQSYNHNEDKPQVKFIYFVVKDINSFFKPPPMQTQVFLGTQILESKSASNHVTYYYKNFKMRQNKKVGVKHYDLAFQGGGAKGLAYVGAYKALKQNKASNGKQIKMKSILGSSAGGITAIAASTGISYLQIQQLCYRMKAVPKKDRIRQVDQKQPFNSDLRPLDEFGNQNDFQLIQKKLKHLSKQFGILNESTFDSIAQIFKGKFKEVQSIILDYLKMLEPSITDILGEKRKVVIQQGMLWWKKSYEKEMDEINWSGIMLHGALMTGNSINDVAAQCLVKYFINNSYHPGFINKITDSFLQSPRVREEGQNPSLQISKLVKQYKQLNKQLFLTPIPLFFENKNKKPSQNISLQQKCEKKFTSQRRLKQFIVFIANQAIVFIEGYLGKDDRSLNLREVTVFDDYLRYSDEFQQKRSGMIQSLRMIDNQRNNKGSIKSQLQGLFSLKQKSIDIIKKRLDSCQNPVCLQENNEQILTCITCIRNHQLIEKLKLQSVQIKSQLEEETKFVYLIRKILDILGTPKYSIGDYFKVIFLLQHLQIEITQENYRKRMPEFEKRMKNMLEQIDSVLSSQSLQQINAYTNQFNLINHAHFQLTQSLLYSTLYGARVDNLTIASFLEFLFENISHFKQETLSVSTLTAFLDKMSKKQVPLKSQQLEVVKITQDFANSVCSFFQQEQLKEVRGRIVEKKVGNFAEFIKEASKITMKEYYVMNPIEVTCTSVDLDNKILRFFNHKTTPDLPICKAVQMTGSFPVAFKAQRWKKQWGYYHVYHQEQKTMVDITGHEFTDGGLLANFPIKYFDNQIIRKTYFSHSQEQNSIMLGFGLDGLADGSYQKNNNEIKKEYKKNIEAQLAFRPLQSKFSLLWKALQALTVFWNTRWLNIGEKDDKLGNLNTQIIQEIPLLRFLGKIFKAYPKSDRNLNIEAFQQSILIEESSEKKGVSNYELIIKKISQERENKRAMKEQQKKWNIKQCYHKFQLCKKVLKRPKKSLYPNKLMEEWRRMQRRINRQKEEATQALKLMKNGYIELFKDLKKNPQNSQIETEQGQMSLLLIKMLLVSLQTLRKRCKSKSNNQKISEILSQRYAFYNFLASSQNKSNTSPPVNLEAQIQNVRLELNKKAVVNLLEQYNFQEVEKHLGFYGFQQQQLRKYINPISRNITERQRQYIEENYGHLGKKKVEQQLSKLKNIKLEDKELLWRKVLGQLQKNKQLYFTDYSLFDVSENMRKLTRYLYFEIKIKDKFDSENLRHLLEIIHHHSSKIKTEQDLKQTYSKLALINSDIQENSYQNLINPQAKLYFGYLSFHQIFQFICSLTLQGVSKENQMHKLDLFDEFSEYIGVLKRSKCSRIKVLHDFGFDLYTDYTLQRSIQRDDEDADKKHEYYQKVYQKMDYHFAHLQQVKTFTNTLLSSKFQQQAEKLLSLILPKEQKVDIEDFVWFLFNKLQFNGRASKITVQSEITLSEAKHSAYQSLKNLLFGDKLQKIPQFRLQKGFNINFSDYICQNYNEVLKKIRKRELDLRHIQYKFDSNVYVRNNFFPYIQKTLFEHFYILMIHEQIKAKLINNGLQNGQFAILNNVYMRQMLQISAFLRIIILLLSSCSARLQVQILSKKHTQIKQDLIRNYEHLFNLPSNLVTVEALNSAFLIKYQHLYVIAQTFKSILDNKSIPAFSIKAIKKTIKSFTQKKFYLPLFSQDWRLLLKVNFINCLEEEQIGEVQERVINQVIFKKRNQHIIQRSIDPANNKLHLVIEGIGNSASYFCGYYQYMQKNHFQDKSGSFTIKKDDNFRIQMITTTNVFGFLLCLGKSIDEVRQDVYITRNYLFQMFDEHKILEMFNKQGPCASSNRYNGLIDSYKTEVSNAFKIFEETYQKQHGTIDYSQKFSNIRLLVQEEQRYFVQTCNSILDEAAKEIKNVDNNCLDSQKANQIAKRFAFDYSCQFGKRHQYKQYNEASKKLYLTIISQLYSQFGSMLSALICSFISNNIQMAIDSAKAEVYFKGYTIARLLTVYKLKAFIFNKLEEHSLPYNITLKEFYARCKNKIILNFIAVNITMRRVEFLNQFLTPNMPLWAAIIAASTLPIVHRNFWCEREWQNLQGEQMIEREIIEFFKDESLAVRKQTLYNSANYISSIPMELLTNNTLFNRYQERDVSPQIINNLKNLKIIGFAYQPHYSTSLLHLNIRKKYLNISLQLVGKALSVLMRNGATGSAITTEKSQSVHSLAHYNRKYQIKYSPLGELATAFIKKDVTMNALNTLVQSNDNLILQWYYNKVIRLPIKIATLAFNQALDQHIYQHYKLQIPSEKAIDTLLRSYEITKSFIQNIKSRQSRCIQKQQGKWAKKQTDYDKYTVKFSAQVIQIPSKQSGFLRDFVQIIFLNHSKWNQNMYNNFVIQYAVLEREDFKKEKQFVRSENSQILLDVHTSSKLLLRFYYLKNKQSKQGKEKEQKGLGWSERRSEELQGVSEQLCNKKGFQKEFKEYIFDFIEIYRKLPSRNNYQYEFNYFLHNTIANLQATKLNGAKLSKQQLQKLPKIDTAKSNFSLKKHQHEQ